MRVLKVKVISLPHIFQVLYVLCFTGPRYQVSVYRTIGPLFFFLECNLKIMVAGKSQGRLGRWKYTYSFPKYA